MSLDREDELLDLGRQDIILLADRCERAEALVRTLGEALELGESVRIPLMEETDALIAYHSFLGTDSEDGGTPT